MKNLIEKAKGFTLVELMVVIVIVGILAAVAIPKFIDASNKAKASEFPTQLTAIYSGEMGYNAENGTYTPSFVTLTSTGGLAITSTSRWFNYTLGTSGSNASFTGTATVSVAFGNTATTDNATITQDNVKSATTALMTYCPNWK